MSNEPSTRVRCTGAGKPGCLEECPHRKSHRVHRPKQTEFDGNEECTEKTDCYEAGISVRCVPIRSKK